MHGKLESVNDQNNSVVHQAQFMCTPIFISINLKSITFNLCNIRLLRIG